MSEFPFKPGRYGPNDSAQTLDGKHEGVAGHALLMEWLTERGIDPNDVYAIESVTWTPASKPLGFLVYRYRKNREGRKYLSAWRRWLPDRFAAPARRFPKWISA